MVKPNPVAVRRARPDDAAQDGLRPAGPKVLVVEDDPALREILALVLGRDGYQVLEASGGDEALRLIEDSRENERSPLHPVELVLSDVRLRDMTGLRIADEARQRGVRAVILMTSFPLPEMLEQAARAGAAVLSKPFRLDVLRRIVLVTLAEQRSAPR